MQNKSSYNPVGRLQIWKVYEDRDKERELVWDERNTITSGMGVGLSHLFSASGSTSIADYQIINFQIGTGGDFDDYGASTYKLQTPLTSTEYGENASFVKETFQPIESGSLGSSKTFGKIRFSNIHKINKTAVRFTIVLDPNTANITEQLDEIGLFMRNPRGLTPHSPILVAYRPFIGITKTSDYSLIFIWTIQF
jgi:hypothetical protein